MRTTATLSGPRGGLLDEHAADLARLSGRRLLSVPPEGTAVGRRVGLIRSLTFASAYLLLTYLSRQTATEDVHLSLVYPSIGLAVVWFIARRPRRIRALDTALLTVITLVVTLATGSGPVLAVAVTVAHLVQVLAFGTLYRALRAPGPGILTTVRDVAPFVAAAVASTVVAAVPVAVAWLVEGRLDGVDLLMWLSRNTASVVAVAGLGLRVDPIIAHRFERHSHEPLVRWPRGSRLGELGLAVVTSVVAYAAVFAADGVPVAFMLLTFSLWAALRFDVSIAIAHAVLVGVIAVGFTLAEQGPFAGVDDARLAAGLVQAFVGLVVLVTLTLALMRADRDTLLERLARAATVDPLTGLANRRHWDVVVAAEVARAARTGAPLTLVMLDLDHFKSYNDTLGHLAGDDLLTDFAVAASRCLREGDTLARWGGEEFVLALPGCGFDTALAVVDRIRAAVPNEQTCTAGIARWEPGLTPHELVARADAALYAGKQGGRDRAVVHDPVPV